MDREGTLQIVEGRCVLRFERRFGHPPEKVWRALTEYDRPRLLEYRMPTADLPLAGAGDRRTLGFELHADPAGCRLVFTNTFEDRPGAASFAAGWEGCLDALEQELGGSRSGGEDRTWVDAHEAYVDALGLLEGTVQDAPDGWTVRFER